MRSFSLLLSLILGLSAHCQLLLDTSKSAEQLVYDVLLKGQSDLIIENVQIIGSRSSIAAFKNQSPEELIDEGILMSTGEVFDAKGPNQAKNTGKRSSGASELDLQQIATGRVTDAIVLSFDMLALRDSIEFEYHFASEEYPEYVDKGVNDVFGFFLFEIDGRAIRARNIARLADQRTIVSIDNVNHKRNAQYFLRSDFLSSHDYEYWSANPRMAMRAKIFEFDGFTTRLKATARLKKGKKYHFKMCLADVGDRFYDSAVLLKAQSMRASGEKIPKADSIVYQMIQNQVNSIEDLEIEKNGEIKFAIKVNFNANESEILSTSFGPLNELHSILKSMNGLQVNIIGHTDNIGSEIDNQKLSENRAISVRDFLIDKQIKSSRLVHSGKGESQPIESNLTEEGRFQNRRVEFKLTY